MVTEDVSDVGSLDGRDFKVVLVDNSVVRERWPEIEAIVRDAFAGAEFSDPMKTAESVLQYILRGLDGRLRLPLGHVLAISATDKVIGAVFCVPTGRELGETSCDIGYIFTSPHVGGRARLDMLNRLMNLVFDTLSSCGFKQIITDMGTVAGAKTIGRRFFVHAPAPEKSNRWVREL
jgi:hypothetical protein